MPQQRSTYVAHPGFSGSFGVGRRDITPPVGIYARNWGSAAHETAEAIHRPLLATVAAFSAAGGPLQILATLDLGWWRTADDEWDLREALLKEFDLDVAQVMLCVSHTHSGPSVAAGAADRPGGDKVSAYRAQVRDALIAATREALANRRPAVVEWHAGHCNLACRRDQALPGGRIVVGYDPTTPGDGSLVLGRVSSESGAVVAVLVNYACHPTSLGWGNRSISPDYVGAMREVVECALDGAPCLFLQAASGDQAPRRQYAPDPAIADLNGKQLGYAALATLCDMLPPRTRLAFERVEESAAPLGCWTPQPHVPSAIGAAQRFELELAVAPADRRDGAAAPARGDAASRAAGERYERLRQMWQGLEGAEVASLPVWMWRLGDAVFVGVPVEMHSAFQRALREEFASCAVIVLNLVNGTMGYMPPASDFSEDTYQTRTSLFRPGSDEIVLQACRDAIKQLYAGPRAGLPALTS